MARYKFQFWLDADKDDQLLVAEQIDDLKRQRSFASVVRDGIMIVSELRAGRVDLLLKLYPWIAEAIKQPTPPQPPPDTDKIISELKRALLEMGGDNIPPAPPSYPMLKPVSGGLQPITGAGRVIGLPLLDDDDEETLVLKKDTSTTASDNFLKSMMGLQQ